LLLALPKEKARNSINAARLIGIACIDI
jgi:hypothetical protein